MAWVVDKSLDVLLGQVNAAAPRRDRSSDGSIGDPAHQATVSAHNPQDTEDSSDGNDPDQQVDARDITHDPRFPGSDMGLVTEAIRVSRDRRVRLVIFNKRIFASYAAVNRPAWTWGPYAGDNDHSKHAHVETNDVHNDELQPWTISLGGDVAFTELDSNRIAYTDGRVEAFTNLREKTLHGPSKGETVQLVALLRKLEKQIDELVDRPAVEIDYAKLAAALAALAIPSANENANATIDLLIERLRS